MILGLDPGTSNLGWAIAHPTILDGGQACVTVDAGVECFFPRKRGRKPDKKESEELVDLANWFNELDRKYNITHVVIEQQYAGRIYPLVYGVYCALIVLAGPRVVVINGWCARSRLARANMGTSKSAVVQLYANELAPHMRRRKITPTRWNHAADARFMVACHLAWDPKSERPQ